MVNGMEVFKNEKFGEVRVVERGGEPWFVAVDVCRALGIGNTSMTLRRLDEDEKGASSIDTRGGQQEVTIVNEPGLYSLVLGSRKPEAKEFKWWVTHEVIPSIRKHGGYIAGQETMSDEELLAKAVLAAQNVIAERERQLHEAQEKLIEAKPKAVFADAVASSETTILIGELAKLLKQNGIDIGQNRLFSWMRDNGYLIKRGDSYNMPTQKSMNLGLFEIKERTIPNPDGSLRVTKTTKVTGYGQQYFVNVFLQDVEN